MNYSELLKENVSLAPYTTLKIGGKARFFIEAKSELEIIEAIEFAEINSLPTFILGGGSNVLISDDGFDGLVLQVNLKGIEIIENIVIANAGEDWDGFVNFCVEKNLQGLECLSGIPGLIGGTPVQNVGAYGQEVSETILKVRVYDRKTKQILELSNDECRFSYRASIFNTTEKDRFIVLSVTFNLKKDGQPKIKYKDLQSYFGDKRSTLSETRNAVLKIRRAKSMVIDENDPNSKSAGSFFKNPVITNEAFEQIQKKTTSIIPYFPFDNDNLKIPAAWLIEQSGFHKGYKSGTAGLSEKHTLAIINLGKATADEILELKNKIQSQVKKKFNIDLKPEPVFVGFKES